MTFYDFLDLVDTQKICAESNAIISSMMYATVATKQWQKIKNTFLNIYESYMNYIIISNYKIF